MNIRWMSNIVLLVAFLAMSSVAYSEGEQQCQPEVILLGTHPIYYLSPFFGLPRDLNLNILSSFRSIFFIKLSLPMGRPLCQRNWDVSPFIPDTRKMSVKNNPLICYGVCNTLK